MNLKTDVTYTVSINDEGLTATVHMNRSIICEKLWINRYPYTVRYKQVGGYIRYTADKWVNSIRYGAKTNNSIIWGQTE
ncbi:unnamed protein product [Onchocerca flexuosa]|uniref:Leukocidin domain-containing protein n=1 Tax=Onchocerca flexuosa TaxID=387005 RepID=A0A183HG04_9BILA|nr:unnamed protein product [Onchocerca flexuosa]